METATPMGELRRRRIVYWSVGGLVVAAVTIGLRAGAIAVSFSDLWHMVTVKAGWDDSPERLTDQVLWAIRLPRVAGGLLVGSALGAAGAGLQGAFRNPLADAHLVGVAPAAGLGALAGTALSPAGSGPIPAVVGAAVGAIALAALMRRLARNLLEPGQLVLVGLALGLAILALLGAIVLAWDSPRVPTFTFWVFGGLSGATWSAVGASLPFVVVGLTILLRTGYHLDLLALGDSEAQHLGVDVHRLRSTTLVGVGLAVGGAVALGGVIGFVGLIAPLVLRSLVGPQHRRLVLLAAFAGAALLVLLDAGARTVAAPVEIPVGLLSAVFGAPVLVRFVMGGRQ